MGRWLQEGDDPCPLEGLYPALPTVATPASAQACHVQASGDAGSRPANRPGLSPYAGGAPTGVPAASSLWIDRGLRLVERSRASLMRVRCMNAAARDRASPVEPRGFAAAKALESPIQLPYRARAASGGYPLAPLRLLGREPAAARSPRSERHRSPPMSWPGITFIQSDGTERVVEAEPGHDRDGGRGEECSRRHRRRVRRGLRLRHLPRLRGRCLGVEHYRCPRSRWRKTCSTSPSTSARPSSRLSCQIRVTAEALDGLVVSTFPSGRAEFSGKEDRRWARS